MLNIETGVVGAQTEDHRFNHAYGLLHFNLFYCFPGGGVRFVISVWRGS
jgi:hypothetical protein